MTVIEEDLLYIDELTGIYNRRFYTRRFAEEAERASGGSVPLALALIDVDYFKSVNDSYGHHEGDRILRHVAQTLKTRCYEHGALPIRYGGDEFMVLYPGATRDQAVELLQHISDDVRGAKLEIAKAGLVSVTISVGVAAYKEDCETPDDLFQAADRAVYRSKEDGRNRVSIPPSAEAVMFSRDDFHRLFPCPRLVGRHEMLNEIKRHLRLEADMVRPVIVLEGPSGVGKSRLLDTTRSLMDGQRSFLLNARGQPYLVNQPYGAIVDALRILIRSDARLAQRISAHLNTAEIGAIYPLIPDVAGLHLVTPDEASPRTSGRSLITSAILKMLISAADGKPMNIIVDDLHWCDAGTVEVLSQLKTTAEGRSALVVVAMRKTGEVLGESNKAVMDYIVSASPNRILLPVEPLSYSEVREMMAAIVAGIERNQRLVQVVSHKSQALPLLVEEILKFLIQKGIIESRGGQIQINEFVDNDIPSKIHDILTQRALSLDEEVRHMVTTAAVVGNSFDLGILSALEERNEGELLGALDKGVRASLIRADSTDNYRFTSDDAQAAIYEQMDEPDRQALHVRVAELEEERAPGSGDSALGQMAYHYQKAGREERAIHFFRRLQQEYDHQPAAIQGAPPPTLVPEFVNQIAGQLDVQVRDLESGDIDKITNAVLVLLGAGERAIEPLLGLVLSSDDLRARRLGLQCLHRVTKGVVQRLLEALYRTQDSEEKCRVIAALGEYSNTRIVTELAPLVRSHDASVRRAALKVVEANREAFSLELMRSALSDENEGVVQDAVGALGRQGRTEVVPELIQMVKKRTIFSPPRRHAPQREACLALGAIGDRAALPVLVSVLRYTPFIFLMRNKPPDVRAAAAMALVYFPGDETTRVLESATRDHHDVVRSAAKMALMKMRGGSAVEDPDNLDEILPNLPGGQP